MNDGGGVANRSGPLLVVPHRTPADVKQTKRVHKGCVYVRLHRIQLAKAIALLSSRAGGTALHLPTCLLSAEMLHFHCCSGCSVTLRNVPGGSRTAPSLQPDGTSPTRTAGDTGKKGSYQVDWR